MALVAVAVGANVATDAAAAAAASDQWLRMCQEGVDVQAAAATCRTS